jgi:hypothetical protein
MPSRVKNVYPDDRRMEAPEYSGPSVSTPETTHGRMDKDAGIMDFPANVKVSDRHTTPGRRHGSCSVQSGASQVF